MENTPIIKLLLKLSPPVMLALLIQSIYNIVDSFFIAKYSLAGLTALSIIYPIQLLMIALSTGTGTGINILVARMDGSGDTSEQKNLVKSGLFLGFFNYICFALIGILLIGLYFSLSSDQLTVQTEGVAYARVVFLGSFGLFIEANCTKILQAKGDMLTPMVAQVLGAAINIALDPLLIFGFFGFPKMGIIGAAVATIVGQIVAMTITLAAVRRLYDFSGHVDIIHCKNIYQTGLPSIVMQSLYTLYIVGLNLILKQFTEDAVTVLGIFFKLQTFFYIPLMGLQQVILPVVSFNYGAGYLHRAKAALKYAIIFSCSVMVVALAIFLIIPGLLLSIFSTEPSILSIGITALRIISFSFVPAGFNMMIVVYFQGVERGGASLFTTILRQVFLLVPLAWLFHFAGLTAVWFTFPVTEPIVMMTSAFLYWRGRKKLEATSNHF